MFLAIFVLLAGLCAYFQYKIRSASSNGKSDGEKPAVLKKFQISYLTVALLAMFSDWLQGPYVYQLYHDYGFNQGQIATLFVAGFASSMIFGTVVGSLADNYGRKKMCIAFAVSYFVSCLTKVFPNYNMLLFGRILGGIATSLLFSVFEAWMVCEHFKRGFNSSQLADTFGYLTLGNGLVAVVAGLVANVSVHWCGTTLAPFLVSLVPLAMVGSLVRYTWCENYGKDKEILAQHLSSTSMGTGLGGGMGSSSGGVGKVVSEFFTAGLSSLGAGIGLLRSDPKIAYLGLGQSCFEGAMYAFVFMWTPALTLSGQVDPQPYLGLIFSAFMVCTMLGSTAFTYLVKIGATTTTTTTTTATTSTSISTLPPPPTSTTTTITTTTTATATAPPLPTTTTSIGGQSQQAQIQQQQQGEGEGAQAGADMGGAVIADVPYVVHLLALLSSLATALFIDRFLTTYLSFLAFEVSVGMFYPGYGTLKGRHIPEEVRSSVMNIFRVPLNGFVILVLLKVQSLEAATVFYICAALHALGLVCYYKFDQRVRRQGGSGSGQGGQVLLPTLKLLLHAITTGTGNGKNKNSRNSGGNGGNQSIKPAAYVGGGGIIEPTAPSYLSSEYKSNSNIGNTGSRGGVIRDLV